MPKTSSTLPRVVITGVGTINPLGTSAQSFYEALIRGESGIKAWPTSLCPPEIDKLIDCRVGGYMGDFDFLAHLTELKPQLSEHKFTRLKKMFRSCTFSNKMAVLSALEAFLDAKLFDSGLDPFRAGILIAGHNFNHQYMLSNNLRFLSEPTSIDLLCGIEALDTNIAATISEVLGCQGPTYTVGGACASGNLALRDAMREIQLGDCDVAVVTGAPFDITVSDIFSMTLLGAVVTDPELQADPTKACRPFDVRRNGFVPSHGAATIVVESLDRAVERGATIYGEILGVKAYSDGSRLPSPSAEVQSKLILDLFKQTGVAPEQVDYVNCHATSTKIGDLEEIEAIKGAFGAHAKRLKLNAPKSMLGHTTWSAALVETIGALLQMKHGMLHPSINIDELDPAIDLDVCREGPQKHEINCFLKNSFGFGGLNCSMLVGRYDE